MNGETNAVRVRMVERRRREAAHLYMTVPEVAELLRTTTTAIYTMVHRGQLPGVRRIGRRILVRRSAVLRWLEGKAASRATAAPLVHPGCRDSRSSWRYQLIEKV